MIINTLHTVAKYIPRYWPLQSFVPTNPLEGLMDKPFDQALHEISRFTLLNGTLKIQDYHNSYYIGKINLNNLHDSVREFVETKGLNLQLVDQLTTLFLDKSFQYALEGLFNSEIELESILISNYYESKSDYLETHKVKHKLLRFFSSFFDLGQAKWQLPVKSNELFMAWKEYVVVEGVEQKKLVATLPDDPILVLEYLFKDLAIAEPLQHDYLLAILFQVLGWASLIKWLEQTPDNPFITRKASLASICAIWLCYESLMHKCVVGSNVIVDSHRNMDDRLHRIIAKHITKPSEVLIEWKVFTKYNVCLIWQRALELNYQNKLMNLLLSHPVLDAKDLLPDAQAIFCIDIRSEGMRRNIENRGNYTTFGYAGFFGIGFKFCDVDNHIDTLQAPPLNAPSVTLNKTSGRKKLLSQIKTMLDLGFAKTKRAFFAPVVLFDIVGLWFSLELCYKTLIPGKLYTSKHVINYNDINVFALPNGFSLIQLTEIAYSVLTSIGLTQNFAKFVIITAHMTECENNPYESSLNCGACGSNSGVPNAIAFCQALNHHDVRLHLARDYAINIPKTTLFICACHNTAKDTLTYFNENLVPVEDMARFKKVKHDFKLACIDLKHEKRLSLRKLNAPTTRKAAWAELIPEQGQANNAAFIIGPRKMSRCLNLGRRTFLQSYDSEIDCDGTILSTIFKSALLIVHGINSQYYFSSTDQSLYGSGNKALQNIIGRLGVVEGNSSDLKIGYPKQSVSYQNSLIHEPLRLLVIVYAKQSMVDQILANNIELQHIFSGNWATLKVIEA